MKIIKTYYGERIIKTDKHTYKASQYGHTSATNWHIYKYNESAESESERLGEWINKDKPCRNLDQVKAFIAAYESWEYEKGK